MTQDGLLDQFSTHDCNTDACSGTATFITRPRAPVPTLRRAAPLPHTRLAPAALATLPATCSTCRLPATPACPFLNWCHRYARPLPPPLTTQRRYLLRASHCLLAFAPDACCEDVPLGDRCRLYRSLPLPARQSPPQAAPEGRVVRGRDLWTRVTTFPRTFFRSCRLKQAWRRRNEKKKKGGRRRNDAEGEGEANTREKAMA